MGTCEKWCSTGFDIRSFIVSYIYIYKRSFFKHKQIPILFADDTTIIISNTNPEEFKNNSHSLMTEITNWFQNNLLTVNCNKTHFMQFLTLKTK